MEILFYAQICFAYDLKREATQTQTPQRRYSIFIHAIEPQYCALRINWACDSKDSTYCKNRLYIDFGIRGPCLDRCGDSVGPEQTQCSASLQRNIYYK